ncbi:alpha beta hydrolase fold family, partial [Lecanosticta acicola]
MAHAWTDLPSALSSALPKANKAAQDDEQLKAFTTTNAIAAPATFGIKAAGSNNAILVHVTNGKADIQAGTTKDCLFVLSALPEQWQEFMKQTPVMPYQSYWGMFGMNIKQQGIEIQGDQTSFAHWTHVWRRVLELIHDAHAGPTPADDEPEMDEDHIVGRYAYITSPGWGKCKVFYEQAGEGDQDIVFLHTAGSDGRQYHGVLNDERMRKKCRMTAFDLPAHGRSFPYQGYWPGKHTNTEDSYVGCIAALVKKLNLNKPIICGASMAGQISLACAVRYKEVGCSGTIPLQGSDYLNMDRQWYDRSPYVNQSLFNPEWIYGMMSPTAPLKNRQLVWHMYSAQAYGVFHGDLDLYFEGDTTEEGQSSSEVPALTTTTTSKPLDLNTCLTLYKYNEEAYNKDTDETRKRKKTVNAFIKTETRKVSMSYYIK